MIYICPMGEFSCIRPLADYNQVSRCKYLIADKQDRIYELANNLELAGNAVRLKILFLLFAETRLCVCDISDILDMTFPAISQHLHKMKIRNLIQSEKEGQTVYYSICSDYKNFIAPFIEMLTATTFVPAL